MFTIISYSFALRKNNSLEAFKLRQDIAINVVRRPAELKLAARPGQGSHMIWSMTETNRDDAAFQDWRGRYPPMIYAALRNAR